MFVTAPLRFIENVLKCGTATFATWRQRTLYDNNCFIILYFVSGKERKNKIYISSHYIFLFGNFRLEMWDTVKIYILSKSQGLVATKPYPHPFLKKKTFFPFLYCFFFLHFKTKIPKKKDINIVGGSKMLWKNISANKPLINLL
jgi:hypothetical protein